jgi:flavin reductase (DIM6/NTAB) family NADH-FMN oxidoreductase RutF
MTIVSKRSIPLDQIYRLIEPGPVVLVTTQERDKLNLMTMSWHMMVDFVPPLIACIISNRNYTFQLLKKNKVCVINIPTVELIKKVVQIGNCSGRLIDKFNKFHLLHERASQINAPLLTECYANIECKVFDMKMAEKYNLFILEGLKGWIRPSFKKPKMIHHSGKGNFIVDGPLLKLPSKMK